MTINYTVTGNVNVYLWVQSENSKWIGIRLGQDMEATCNRAPIKCNRKCRQAEKKSQKFHHPL